MDDNFLNGYEKAEMPSPGEFSVFKKKIAELIKLDLTNYKNAQMERRIVSFMNKNRVNNLQEYYKVLQSDKDQLEKFVNMLTINVSEFFRNPEKFEELEKTYLPELLERKPGLKIWSAGCSIGSEIYTVAMILDKMNVLEKCELIASDFDENILNKAQTGKYSAHEAGRIPERYKGYFRQVAGEQETLMLEPWLINSVRFERRDLLNSGFDSGFDLILCRNVVIYFTDEAKDKLYRGFYDSLSAGGILFIGSTERINNCKMLGYKLRTTFFYQKSYCALKKKSGNKNFFRKRNA